MLGIHLSEHVLWPPTMKTESWWELSWLPTHPVWW